MKLQYYFVEYCHCEDDMIFCDSKEFQTFVDMVMYMSNLSYCNEIVINKIKYPIFKSTIRRNKYAYKQHYKKELLFKM